MENTYEICYYGGMIAAIVLLLITIVLFFVLKIPRVFGELTGLTARRGVKNLKEKGTRAEATSTKEPKHYSQRTGAIKTRTAEAQSSELFKKDNTTGGLIRGKSKKKTSNEDENKTGFLGEEKITAAVTGDMAETAVLSQNEVENKEYGFVDTGKLTTEAQKAGIETTETEEMETDVLTADNIAETAADAAKPVATGTEEAFTSEEDEETEVLSGPENASSGIGDDEPTEVLSFGTDDVDADEPTEVLAGEGDDEPTEVLTAEGDDEPTEVLTAEGDDEPTEVLTTDGDDEEEETVVLTSDEEETAVLTGADAYCETSVLSAEVEKAVKKNYVVLYNVLEVHTSESL